MSSPRKVVVIGAGPAGYVCAIRLAQLGQSATVVEREYVGGTCLSVGCIPSKAMIAAGALMEKVRKASAMGITVDGLALDPNKLVEWKQGIVGKLTGGVGTLLKNHKVPVVVGQAEIADANTVLVPGQAGEERLTRDGRVLL